MTRKPFLLSCLAVCLFFFLSARLGLAAAGEAAPPSPAEDGTLRPLSAIAGEGMMESHAYDYLEELSDDIGGRVTGTPAAAKAIEWGIAKMKAIGLKNVHAEKFQASRGWTRISADAEILAPVHHHMTADSMGWVGSTPVGGVEADMIPVNMNRLDEEMKQNTANWAGKILLVVKKGEPSGGRFADFARFGTFLKAAYDAHAAAVIGGQGGSKSAGMNLTHTGALGYDTYYDIPVVSMTLEDQEQLERFLDRGRPVRMKINVQNRVTDGPVESANVVGEIRGTEHPEQIVVVGGHLDSWDLAEGTTDNGCGTTTTLGAAQAIVASGFKPRRTLRFVLFTGEEQGLLGSFAYIKTHKDEMANHVAAVILDSGQGPVRNLELGGRGDLIPAVEKLANALQAFGDFQVNDHPIFGTDTGPFTLEGLPGINLGQDSPDYKYTHHSAADTFDKVKAEILIRNATVMALTSFWIADRPDRLASPWPAEKTARMLIEKGEDRFLKAFGLWPFGNLGSEPRKNNP
jgi:Zn-dependent M28 family amino/carboxypeptidase